MKQLPQIAIYYDSMSDAFSAFMEAHLKKQPGVIQHRSIRSFNPKQAEKFDHALVDGTAHEAELVAEALTSWGVEVSVSAASKKNS